MKKGQKEAISWTEECSQEVEQLKRSLLEVPLLAFADYTVPFIVSTDASKKGLGAVLAQKKRRHGESDRLC